MAMPKVGAKAQKLKSGGSRFKGWLKEKKGLSRSEEAHVRQLILEREKKASECLRTATVCRHALV